MEKLTATTGYVRPKFGNPRPCGASRAAGTQAWADAETRAFLERSGFPPFTNILRVVLITGMVVALVKIAWILITRA